MKIKSKKIPLKEVATFLNGYAFKPSDWSKEGVPIIRIQNLTGTNKEFNYYNGNYNEKYIIEDGDILISWSASLGIFLWENIRGILNQHIFKVIFDKDIEIDKIYFLHCMKYLIKKTEKNIHGSTMKHITRPEFEKINFPIYEIDIQRKISKKLIFVTKTIENNKKLLDELVELSKSLFTKYSNRKVSKSFYIKDISSELFAGGDKPNDYSENITKEYIYPVYSNGEKKEGLLCFSKTFKVDKEALTISARGTIGFTSIRKAYFTPVVRLITLIPNKNNNIIYLKYAIEKLNLKKLGSGVAQLTIPVFSKYKLNLPPIELQNKFAERIEKIEKLKFEIEKSIEMAQNLYNSLISKYFDN